MPIIRSKSQTHDSLVGFYENLAKSDDTISSQIGKTMIRWIERIEKKVPDAKIYGLTSHMHLILMPGETHHDEWAVKLIGMDNHYTVQYLMPRKHSPWLNAYVTGEFTDFDEAVAMSVRAIQLCNLWPVEQLRTTN